MPRTALRCVTPEDLNVTPSLLGLPLAAPGRRLAAMLLDLALIGLASSLANVWVLAGLGVLGLDHERQLRGRAVPARRPLWWAVAGLLIVGGLVQALMAPAEPPRAARSRAAAPAPVPASASAAVGALGQQAGLAATGALVERIAALEEQLAEGCRPPPAGLQATVARWLDELGLGYGWALLYFSLLPAWWGGQTPGKRLLGLRVVELTGKPMTAVRCLKRFGGYAAGMATGMVGFAQVLWDSNRQGIQDKTAHTVVVLAGGPSARPAVASARDQ